MFTFRVDDMHCGGCARSITTAVHSVDATAQVQVDLARKHVRVQSESGDERSFYKAIADAGFSPITVVTNPTAKTHADACGCQQTCACA